MILFYQYMSLRLSLRILRIVSSNTCKLLQQSAESTRTTIHTGAIQFNEVSNETETTTFEQVATTKHTKNPVQLSDVDFWNTEYTRPNNTTEWYLPSEPAALHVLKILNNRQLLQHNKTNILLEIGCGPAPVLTSLIPMLQNSPYLTVGVVTDSSPVCVLNLRTTYGTSSTSEPLQLSLLRSGIYSVVLDVKDILTFLQSLRQFTDINGMCDESMSTEEPNVIVIDKGCLDALIWDRNVEYVGSVVNNATTVISVSGEDPDSRIQYFQENFSKLFSVHTIEHENREYFAYSYTSK